DFDVAVDNALNAVYFHAGQVCSAGARLIVEDSIHDDFVTALKKRVENIVLGNGMDDQTEMGPLISKEHLNKVSTYVENGINEVEKLLVEAKHPGITPCQDGFFRLLPILPECTTEWVAIHEKDVAPVF